MVTIPDEASNATDHAMMSVLEDHADDPVAAELRGFIGALTEDEQVDLVALAWLGRGDGTLEDWEDLRAEAARLHNKRTASYLLGNAAAARSSGGCTLPVRPLVRKVRNGTSVGPYACKAPSRSTSKE
jgi:hypothetical protein